MKEKQLQDITALYGRLSRDDEVGGESMSSQSQRAILGQYAKEHAFRNCQFFMDDGYAGCRGCRYVCGLSDGLVTGRAVERTENLEKGVGRSPAPPVRTGHAGAAHLDNVFGRLSDDLYQTLSAKYEAETKELKTRAAEIQALLTEATTKTQGIQDFTDLVASYANITEFDEELVHTQIEKIIIHEKEIIDGETVMRIEIYYRFIGKTSDCLNRFVTPIKTKTESVVATDSIA